MSRFTLCLLGYLLGTFVTAEEAAFDWKFNTGPNMPRAIMLKPDGSFVDQLPDSFTFCFFVKVHIRGEKDITLISYASYDTGYADEVKFHVDYKKSSSALFMKWESATFNAVPRRGGWTHVCVAWSNSDGNAVLYLDGQATPGDNPIQEGNSLGTGGCLVFGQDQYYFNDFYYPEKGLNGSMTQIQLFNRLLNDNEVKDVMNCKSPGDLADWADTKYGLYDNMMVEATTAPCYVSCDGTVKTNPCKNTAPTYMSTYDMTSGFADNVPHDVTATLKGVTFKRMRECTICFQLFNKAMNFRMQPITYGNDKGSKNGFSFGFMTAPTYGFYMEIGDKIAVLPDGLPDNTIVPLCLTWSSSTGDASFYYKGELLETVQNIGKGFTIPAGLKLKIHQRQFAPLNKKKPTDGFRYKTSDIRMWNRALTAEDVASYTNCTGSVDDSILDPSNTEWDVQDEGCPAFAKTSPIEGTRKDTYEYDKPTEVAGMLQFYEKMPPPEMNDSSFCFWAYSLEANPTIPTFFATKGYNGFSMADGVMTVKFQGQSAKFPGDSYWDDSEWQHFCVSRKADSGKLTFYVGGKNVGDAEGIAPGYTIPAGSWIIRNFMTGPPSKEDPAEGFLWKGTEYNVWNQPLTDDDVKAIYACPLTIQGSVINSRTAIWKREY